VQRKRVQRKTKEVFNHFDATVQQSFQETLSELRNHNNPIISLTTLNDFLNDTRPIFGDIGDFMLHLCGAANVQDKPNKAVHHTKAMEDQEITTFLKVLFMTSLSNKQLLTH
jgi:hypothetical protein